MSGKIVASAAAVAVACTLAFGAARAVRAAADSQANAQMGVFALLDGAQEAVAKGWAHHGVGPAANIKVRLFKSDGTTPVMDYAVRVQNSMHLIIVRDDFATLTYLDTAYNTGTGTVSGDFTAQPHHGYYLYSDSIPIGMKRQVFRFKSTPLPPAAPQQPASTTPTKVASAGPYVVTLERDTFPANSQEILYSQVTRDGKPAQDLAPFLNGAAQAVFINAQTLQYVYLHPMLRGSKVNDYTTYDLEQEARRISSNSLVGPNMQMVVPPLPPGVYKFWLRFAGGVSMHDYSAGPFTIVAQ
ncbi:MAG TPA: hypothetical protein VGF86_03255 [Candidatus Tumulicola sp.]